MLKSQKAEKPDNGFSFSNFKHVLYPLCFLEQGQEIYPQKTYKKFLGRSGMQLKVVAVCHSQELVT